ncbi:MFS transporter [Streptomyces sp. NEAU-sy36]|uniref:MFS transporter n=1 Tax=unclassified Streptomyces TaxID=2593676 RepID=UPI0015D5EDF2|nr:MULTISPECIES: MFS transporter [unclassified Streptomyces]QLJ02817.1 MFS transporter [Streptomyces sp. NEAU-sy36]
MALTTGTVRSSTFRLLWAGQTVSVIGDGAAALAVPLLVIHATGSAVLGALAATPRTVAYLLVGFLAGPVVDRLQDSRRIMVVCDLLRFAVFAALPLAVHAPLGPGLVLVLAFAASSAGVFFETALAVAVQSSLRSEDLVTGNARLEMSNQVGLLLGPAVIGAGVAAFGVPSAMWFNAATFLISAATLVPMRFGSGRESVPTSGARPTVRRDMAEGLRYIRTHALILRLVSLQVVINLVIAAETLVVFYATHDLHASAAWIGAVLAAAGLGGVAATSVANLMARRFDSGRLIGLSVVGLGGTLLAIGMARDPLVLAAANFFHGGLSVFASVHIRAVRQRVVPPALLGRVTANARTFAFAANPLGALLFGSIAASANGQAQWSFFTAAVLSVASAAVAYRGLVAPAAEPTGTADPLRPGTARDGGRFR